MSKNSTVGSLAVTSFDFDEWFKTKPVINTSQSKKFNKKLVYPLFLTFSELTTDAYWVKKFHLWANGKLPKGFTFDNNVITFNKGPTWIGTNNPSEDVLSCIQFFMHYGGFFSKNDEMEAKKQSTDDDEEEPEEKNVESWTHFNKYEQEILVRMYVNDVAQSHLHLTPKETRLLLQTIRLGIATKNIANNAIEIKNNKISHIKGLMWNEQDRAFRVIK